METLTCSGPDEAAAFLQRLDEASEVVDGIGAAVRGPLKSGSQSRDPHECSRNL